MLQLGSITYGVLMSQKCQDEDMDIAASWIVTRASSVVSYLINHKCLDGD